MKRIFLFVFILVAVGLLGFFGFKRYTKSFSPETVVENTWNDLDLKVTYSKPGKKGRLIFGREQDKALVPYGKVWRTGANEATIIELAKDVDIAGKLVKAGTYSIYSVPGQSSWKIILNSDVGQWGTEYNDGKDVLTVDVPIRIRPTVQELFNISFEGIPNGTNMVLSWDQTEALVPFTNK